jgi:hypothetical protein
MKFGDNRSLNTGFYIVGYNAAYVCKSKLTFRRNTFAFTGLHGVIFQTIELFIASIV